MNRFAAHVFRRFRGEPWEWCGTFHSATEEGARTGAEKDARQEQYPWLECELPQCRVFVSESDSEEGHEDACDRELERLNAALSKARGEA